MIPSDNDTWGISGPAFLLAYVVLAVAVGVTAVLTRRRLADGSPAAATTRRRACAASGWRSPRPRPQ